MRRKLVKVALIQMRCREKPEMSQVRAEEMTREAVQAGAEMVLLPELYRCFIPQANAHKEDLVSGEMAKRWSALSKELDVHILAGSHLEAVEGDERCYNTCLFYNNKGDQLTSYRKMHLYDIDIEGVVYNKESDTILPGTSLAHTDTPFGRMGFAICYDLRFPEIFRKLSEQQVDIQVLPAAFNRNTGPHHWQPLLQARAIENQVYMLAPNQVGDAPNGFQCYGHSMVVDPWGTIIAEGSGDQEEIVYAELDLERLQSIRKSLPSLQHRKYYG